MKKWTKVLSAFVVATVMSTGVAAMAGCDSCDDDEHQHTYAAEWSTDKDYHWKESDCGHEPTEKEAHKDEYKNGTEEKTPDGKCDVCGYVLGAEIPPVGKVTVTFNSDGGSAVPSQSIDKGGKATKPTNPTKANHTFAGWFAEGATTEFDFNTVINANITLTAHWTPNGTVTPVGKVTVTFDTDGGSAVPSQSIDKGGKATRPETDPTKENFTFAGWFAEGATTEFNFDTVINENITLTAHWTANGETPVERVTVTFVVGEGATAPEAQTIDKGGKATRPETDPTKDGHRFGGWFKGEDTTEFDFETVVNENITLTAKWIEQVTVTFVVGEGATAPAAQTIDKGGNVEIPETPHKTGFAFVGWFTDNETFANAFDFGAPVNGTINVYAKWKAPETPFEILSARADNLISQDFTGVTKDEIPVHSGVYGNSGVYVYADNGVNVADSVYNIVDGSFVVGNSNGTKGDPNIHAIIDFGVVSNVEGYFEFKFGDEASGDGNSVIFNNQNKSVLEIVANGKTTNGKFKFKINGVEVTDAPAVTANKDTLYKVEFKFDADKKLTLKINGTVVFNEIQTEIEAITGIDVKTSNSGMRTNTIDNIAICGTAVSLADYQASLSGKLDSKLAAMTDSATGTHKVHATEVEEKCTAGKTAIGETTDLVAAYTAYNNAVKAMNAVTSDVQQLAINYIGTVDEGRYNSANYTQNVEAYATEIAKILAETDATKLTVPDATADPVVEAGATLKAVLDAIKAIDNDETCFNHYLNDKADEIEAEYPHGEYLISQQQIMADVMQAFPDFTGEFDYDKDKTYAENTAFLDTFFAKYLEIFAAAKTDATIISEVATTKVDEADIANYRNDDISALSETLQATINAEKANAVKTVSDGITSLEGYYNETIDGEPNGEPNANYYVTVITANIAKLKASIDQKIDSEGKTVEEIKAEVKTAYGQFIDANAQFIDVKEHNETYAGELKAAALAAYDTAVADIEDKAAVYDKQTELQNDFVEWLEGQLAAKTFKITLNGVELETTVKYGEIIDVKVLGDPTKDNDSLMIDPTDSNLYLGDPEDGKIYYEDDSGKIYSDVSLNYKTVAAVKVNQLLSAPKLQLMNDNLSNNNVEGVITFTDTASPKKHVIESSEISYNGVDYTHRLKTGGGTNDKNKIAITLTKKSNVYIVARAGGATERSIFLSSKQSTSLSDKLNDSAILTFKDDTTTTRDINIDLEAGTYYINYTNGMSIYEIRITEYGLVKVPAIPFENISVRQQGDELRVKVGETLQLEYLLDPEDTNFADRNSVVWSVKEGDESKAIIDSKTGLLTATAEGSVEVTVTISDLNGAKKSATVSVEVFDVLLEDVSITNEDGSAISADPIELAAGSTLQLVYVLNPDAPSDVTSVVWSSSDDTKVSVDQNGLVTANSAGENIEITVTASKRDGTKKTATVKITVPAVSAEGIALIATASVGVGQEIILTPTITPDGASGYEIEWSTGNADTATVSNGKVTGVAAGEVVITATLKVDGVPVGTPATCTVTVVGLVDVTHTLNVDSLTAAGLAVGNGGAINTTIDGFTNGSVKLSNKNATPGYISSTNGTITFTTQSDNAVFKVKFQAKASDRGFTITGPAGDDGVAFTATQMETKKDEEFSITLGKAGTYTIQMTNNEVKFYYMSYTHKEMPKQEVASARAANASTQIEAVVPVKNEL